MSSYAFTLAGASLAALPSGALFWADMQALVVSDLHLGKSERLARRGGTLLPPYEVSDTLTRLDTDIDATAARLVICLGDSFDDPAAAALAESHALWLARMMAGRRWIWIEGNHDPGPVAPGGEHLRELALGPLTFRHIARPHCAAEVSGHYHPGLRLAGQARRCFILDRDRLVLPAYGTYAGGLRPDGSPLARLLHDDAIAILTGRQAMPVPLHAAGRNRPAPLQAVRPSGSGR